MEQDVTVTILKVAAEGGSMKLLGKCPEDQWLFRLEVNEMMFDELDLCEVDDLQPDEKSHTQGSKSYTWIGWDDVEKLLVERSFFRLYPCEVHPLFRERIWEMIQRLPERSIGRQMGCWERICCDHGDS